MLRQTNKNQRYCVILDGFYLGKRGKRFLLQEPSRTIDLVIFFSILQHHFCLPRGGVGLAAREKHFSMEQLVIQRPGIVFQGGSHVVECFVLLFGFNKAINQSKHFRNPRPSYNEVT